jgi:hypothetical protein
MTGTVRLEAMPSYLDKAALIATHDLLMLVGFDVPLDVIRRWTIKMREQAENFAAREHLAANNNLVSRVPCPGFLEKYGRKQTAKK